MNTNSKATVTITEDAYHELMSTIYKLSEEVKEHMMWKDLYLSHMNVVHGGIDGDGDETINHPT